MQYCTPANMQCEWQFKIWPLDCLNSDRVHNIQLVTLIRVSGNLLNDSFFQHCYKLFKLHFYNVPVVVYKVIIVSLIRQSTTKARVAGCTRSPLRDLWDSLDCTRIQAQSYPLSSIVCHHCSLPACPCLSPMCLSVRSCSCH